MLFHHRFPTSTENTRRGAHPYHTGDYFGNVRYVLAHNGRIRNHGELKKEHEALGISYVSTTAEGKYNDSEALLWDFALTQEGKQEKMKAYGDMAFICVKLVDNEPVDLLFGRNYARPLKMKRHKRSMTLSSEGEGEDISTNKLYTYNYDSSELTEESTYFAAFEPFERESYISHNYNYSGFSESKIKGYGSPTYYDDYFINEYGQYEYYEWDYDDDGDNDLVLDNVSLESLWDEPDEVEVEQEFYRVLDMADGLYMDAYWLAQSDVYTLEQLGPDRGPADTATLKLLKAVCQKIVDDKCYVNETSVHPLWEENMEITTVKSLQAKGA